MNTPLARRSQWAQLIALSLAHFAVDCFPGLMHTVLPAIQNQLGLTVQAGAVLLTVFLVAANGIQVLTGHLRPEKEKPLFLYIGMLMATTIVLFSFVPKGTGTMPVALTIAVICAAGIGITHPEALRAVHRIDGIHSALSSSVFMGFGIGGFAVGSWASTYLFQWWGFWGQWPFCVLALLAAAAIRLTGVRLAVEEIPTRRKHAAHDSNVPFWPVMAIATLTAIAAQIMCWLIPQHLNQIGADLSLGGIGVAMFSLSGGIGGIIMSRTAARRGEAAAAAIMLTLGIPFIAAYLGLMRFNFAPAIMFVGGFFCYGAYPILVSLARQSRGPRLGQRMGLIVGGIWLGACLLPMLLAPLVARIGAKPILMTAPAIFAAAGLLAAWTAVKSNRSRSNEITPSPGALPNETD